MPPDDDDQDRRSVQEAITESLRARTSNQATQSMDRNAEDDEMPVQTCQNRVSIDDRINDLTMQAAIELPIIYDSQGDTLIYIDAPQKQPEQNEHDYERYIKRYKAPMLMQKETLAKYSPGLAKLFGPTQQYRFLRRRKLANKLPSNVKYVIDLTPPTEGEDAVFLTTELCCSEGVRLWHQSNQIWNVATTLVNGEEDYPSLAPEVSSNNVIDRKTSARVNTSPTGFKAMSSKAKSSALLPLEYSPVRHRSAIERVLSALQGKDPILDSATKVWTTFAVAKNFEITHSPLEDYIIRWLRAYPNSYFLEVLPEVSHRIADGLQNYDLARDSFAILVGEEALDSLRHAREPREHKRTTFGRKKEELPEHMHTRIEYASKSFLERINSDFADLVVNDMQWIDELPEVRRISAYTQPEIQDTIRKLKDLVKDYIRGAVYKVLCADYESVPGPELHHDGGHELLPRVNRAAVWVNLPLEERILSRTFWEALRSFDTFQGATNLDSQRAWRSVGDLDLLGPIEKRELDRGTYREIKKSDIKALMRKGQTHLDQAWTPDPTIRNAQLELDAGSSSRRLHTLPDRIIFKAHGERDLLSAHTSDYDLYDAQRESNIKPLPKPSYALPDHTPNGTRGILTNSKASFAIPAQPIDVPRPLKRTQHFPDALAPPGKRFEFDVGTKWPFGAARDDPIDQVQKSVDSLHFSLSAEPAGQGARNEESPSAIDAWYGYRDQLSQANKPPLTPIKAAPEKRVDPVQFDNWIDHNELDGDDGDQQQNEDSMTNNDNLHLKFFYLEDFFFQAQKYIEVFAANKLRSPGNESPMEPLEFGIVNTLVCLEDSEWKYLPLWAGGNDDGSMGVYNDDLPTAEHGFTTAGPEVHDGLTPAGSLKTSSEYDLVSAGDSASTFNSSTATNRGFSDMIRRGHVQAADSLDDSISDSFTMMTPSVDSVDEEIIARMQIEAQERMEEAEEAAATEARRTLKGKGKMVEEDETYADLFDGEEEDDGNDTDRAEVNDDEWDDEDMVMV